MDLHHSQNNPYVPSVPNIYNAKYVKENDQPKRSRKLFRLWLNRETINGRLAAPFTGREDENGVTRGAKDGWERSGWGGEGRERDARHVRSRSAARSFPHYVCALRRVRTERCRVI